MSKRSGELVEVGGRGVVEVLTGLLLTTKRHSMVSTYMTWGIFRSACLGWYTYGLCKDTSTSHVDCPDMKSSTIRQERKDSM